MAIVAIKVFEPSYTLNPVSLSALSVHDHEMLLEESAVPLKPDGAADLASEEIVAIALLVSPLSYASVYAAAILSPSAHVSVPLLLLLDPVYSAVASPLLRKMPVALPVSVSIMSSLSVAHVTVMEKLSGFWPSRLRLLSVIARYTLSDGTEYTGDTSKSLFAK